MRILCSSLKKGVVFGAFDGHTMSFPTEFTANMIQQEVFSDQPRGTADSEYVLPMPTNGLSYPP